MYLPVLQDDMDSVLSWNQSEYFLTILCWINAVFHFKVKRLNPKAPHNMSLRSVSGGLLEAGQLKEKLLEKRRLNEQSQ